VLASFTRSHKQGSLGWALRAQGLVLLPLLVPLLAYPKAKVALVPVAPPASAREVREKVVAYLCLWLCNSQAKGAKVCSCICGSFSQKNRVAFQVLPWPLAIGRVTCACGCPPPPPPPLGGGGLGEYNSCWLCKQLFP
jgi:hypothetical protein